MSPSSTSTTTAATATVVDADTNSVGADNQATFYRDDGPNPTAADLSWTCEESPPVGPIDSQKTAVEALKKYAVRQGFVISVCRSRSIGSKRSFSNARKENICGVLQSAHVNARSRNNKGRLYIRARDHV